MPCLPVGDAGFSAAVLCRHAGVWSGDFLDRMVRSVPSTGTIDTDMQTAALLMHRSRIPTLSSIHFPRMFILFLWQGQ